MRVFNLAALYSGTELQEVSLLSHYSDPTYFSGSLKIYIPWKFNSGGWYRGIVPQINYGFSNEILNKGIGRQRKRMHSTFED